MPDNPALSDCWDWLSGNAGATVTGSGSMVPVSDLIQSLDADTEVERVTAAYSLAEAARCGSTDALDGLITALQAVETGRESTGPYQAGSSKVLPRVAMRGLAATGTAAVPPLLSMLNHPSPTVVAAAAFALGEAAPPSLQVIHGLHGAYSTAYDSITALAGDLDLGSDTAAGNMETDTLGLRILSEDNKERMDPEITSVRRVCAVAAQALGLIGGRAAAVGSAEVRKELAQILASRLAQPEPGAELVEAGIIRDGMGGSTGENTHNLHHSLTTGDISDACVCCQQTRTPKFGSSWRSQRCGSARRGRPRARSLASSTRCDFFRLLLSPLFYWLTPGQLRRRSLRRHCTTLGSRRSVHLRKQYCTRIIP